MKQKTYKPKMTLEKLARITQDEFRRMRGEFATKKDLKEELKGFVTKGDLKEELKGFVTKGDLKEELKRFATKEDLLRFATKEDLEQSEERVIDQLSKKVIQSNDKLITKLDTFFKEQSAHKWSHDRMDETLDDHKTRIKKLEDVVRPV